MKNTLYPNTPESITQYSYVTSLRNWMKEISTFYLYYERLAPYIDQTPVSINLQLINRNLHSQCTVSQLQRFLRKMRTALKQLLHDMDIVDSDPVPATKSFCRKLIAHTRMLHRLNEEARKMNLLTVMADN